MKTRKLFYTLITFIIILVMSVMTACNHSSKSEANVSSIAISEKEDIPDSVVQFLITSAGKDFRSHQPPTPIDIRNVEIGYIKSPNNEKTFVLCGEFLSKENNKWTDFTTIKTSGYEQYFGKTQYCQDAIMVLTDESLSVELKNKLNEQ